MICPNCKNEIPNDSKFCPDCGSHVEGLRTPSIYERIEQTLDFEKCIGEINKNFILTN